MAGAMHIDVSRAPRISRARSGHVVELLEVRHGLWLGIQLFPCGDLLEDVREHVTRSAVLRPEHLAHAEQVARLLDEVLEVVIIALVGEVSETDLFGRELVVKVE